MDVNVSFSNMMLAQVRQECREHKIKLPKGIVAIKVGRQQYAVQADSPYNHDHYVDATCCSEAKAQWISDTFIAPLDRTEE